MKVGIGICTYNRPEEARKTADAIVDNTPALTGNLPLEVAIAIADDHSTKTVIDEETQESRQEPWIWWQGVDEILAGTKLKISIPVLASAENQGVCYNKNKLLARFEDCDLVIIFEDDCRPCNIEWLERYVDAMAAATQLGIHHINYVHPTRRGEIHNVVGNRGYTFSVHQHLMGVMMVMTRHALKTVGGLDRRFHGYGFGHVEYSERCIRAGLAPGFVSLDEAEEFIFWDQAIPAVLNDEEKQPHIERNRQVWGQTRQDPFLFRMYKS